MNLRLVFSVFGICGPFYDLALNFGALLGLLRCIAGQCCASSGLVVTNVVWGGGCLRSRTEWVSLFPLACRF